MKSFVRNTAAVLAGALALAACDGGTGVGAGDTVSLNFRVPGGSPAMAPRAGGPALVAGPPMTLQGTNGSLRIDEIRVIVAEVELNREDDDCDDLPGASDDCDEFEAPPRFLDLPLDGAPITAVSSLVPPGVYKELDFEIEDLEDDETDPVLAAAIEAVRVQVLAEIPDWPRKASALVAGAFTPNGGEPIDFRVFLEAEIEVELELLPRLVVDDEGGLSREITVDVAPEMWFLRPDGSLLPLSDYDYDTTGLVLEFELEMENGFTEIEIG